MYLKIKKTSNPEITSFYIIIKNYYLTAALNSEPALKVTTFIAGILIF